MQVILASGSPRRQHLLAGASVDFVVMTAAIDENVGSDESPQDYIQRMVHSKAQAAVHLLNHQRDQLPTDVALALASSSTAPILLLTADTIGVLPDGQTILTKPNDYQHAQQMWQQMSGATHAVYTAVLGTMLVPSSMGNKVAQQAATKDDTAAQAPSTSWCLEWQQSLLERTEVTFVPLSAADMQRYWQSGEPADKAGAYAIQGGAAPWVSRISGSYTNVVGLPLAQTLSLIKSAQKAALTY